MSIYNTRTTFFETMAKKSKAIGHLVDGRYSFARINEEEEFDAIVTSNAGIASPCLVHIGLSIVLNSLDNVTLDKVTANGFWILAKEDSLGDRSSNIQKAWDDTLAIVMKCIAYIRHNNAIDTDNYPHQSEFENIDWSRCRINQKGPVNNNWYGWEVIFLDESAANTETTYSSSDWY